MSALDSNPMSFPPRDITQQMMHMIQAKYAPNEITSFPRIMSYSNGQTFHGVLPVHLCRFCERMIEIREEMKERFANEEVDFQNIGITPKTRLWFLQMTFDVLTLSLAIESAILQLYPKSSAGDSTFYISRDWEVLSYKQGFLCRCTNPLRDTTFEASVLMAKIFAFHEIGTEHELKTPSV